MKIDTFLEHLETILKSDDFPGDKIISIRYWTMLFKKQREQYLKSKQENEPEALGTGTV